MNNFNLSNGKSIDVNELKKAVETNKTQDYIDKKLSPDAAKKLKTVLSDKQTMEKMLSTPQARELLNQLMKK